MLPVGIGISLRNASAVVEGLVHRGGYFRRTPKRGQSTIESFERKPRIPIGELILATFFMAAAIAFCIARQWVSLPFIGLFLGGYAYIVFHAFDERLSYSRSGS